MDGHFHGALAHAEVGRHGCGGRRLRSAGKESLQMAEGFGATLASEGFFQLFTCPCDSNESPLAVENPLRRLAVLEAGVVEFRVACIERQKRDSTAAFFGTFAVGLMGEEVLQAGG